MLTQLENEGRAQPQSMWNRFLTWTGVKKEVPLQVRIVPTERYEERGDVELEQQGNAVAFGAGSFGHPANAAVSSISQSAAQPQEFSVYKLMEALDGKPLTAAFFGASKSGKTLTTGTPLHSLQSLMGFQNLLYGLGDSSSYDSPDNETLRQFVHKDQVTVISCPADIGNLIDRAVSTHEKKVIVLDDIMHFMEGDVTKKIGILCSMGRKSQTSFVGIFHANIGGRQKAVVLNGLTVIVVCEAMYDLLEQRTLIPKEQVEAVRGWMKQITKEQKLLYLPSSVEIKCAFWMRPNGMRQQLLIKPKVNRAPAAAAQMDVSFDEDLVVSGSGPAPGKRPLRLSERFAAITSSSDEEENMPQQVPKPKVVRKRKENFDLEKELAKVVGMESVKDKIRVTAKNLNKKMLLKKKGITLGPAAKNHTVFVGNPGTGKTTFARIFSKVLSSIGAIKNDTVVEVQRSDLVADYVGQTATKTGKKILEAAGGVLFLDEAYQLCNASENDYGREAVEEIMRHMIDGETLFFFAGYPQQMEEFLKMNDGLRRRIGYTFLCPDMSSNDLAAVVLVKLAAESSIEVCWDVDDIFLENVFDSYTTQKMRSEQNGGLASKLKDGILDVLLATTNIDEIDNGDKLMVTRVVVGGAGKKLKADLEGIVTNDSNSDSSSSDSNDGEDGTGAAGASGNNLFYAGSRSGGGKKRKKGGRSQSEKQRRAKKGRQIAAEMVPSLIRAAIKEVLTMKPKSPRKPVTCSCCGYVGKNKATCGRGSHVCLKGICFERAQPQSVSAATPSPSLSSAKV